MRQAKRTWALPRSFRVDGRTMIIALMALGLLIGMVWRIGPTPDVWASTNDSTAGLRVFSQDDRLVSFEDFEFNEGGFSGAAQSNQSVITGGILGPVAAGLVIQKPILLPLGFRNAVLELDLWLLDGWDGAAVELSFADAALRITGEAHAPVIEIARQSPTGTRFQLLDAYPKPDGSLQSGEETTRLSLRIAVSSYDAEGEISLFGSDDTNTPYRIAIDNLRVIVSDTPLDGA